MFVGTRMTFQFVSNFLSQRQRLLTQRLHLNDVLNRYQLNRETMLPYRFQLVSYTKIQGDYESGSPGRSLMSPSM